jgi:hypothetical protein
LIRGERASGDMGGKTREDVVFIKHHVWRLARVGLVLYFHPIYLNSAFIFIVLK